MGCGSSVRPKYEGRASAIKEPPVTTAPDDCPDEWSSPAGPGPAEQLRQAIKMPSDAFAEASKDNFCCLGALCFLPRGEPVTEAESENKQIVTTICDVAVQSFLAERGIGFTCRQGRQDRPNQDNILLCRGPTMTVFAVADGRGDNGHWASLWVAQAAMALALSDVIAPQQFPKETALARIFNVANDFLMLQASHQDVDLSQSGTTLTLCFVDHEGGEVLTAWIGDSRCLLASDHGSEDTGEHFQPLTGGYDPRDFNANSDLVRATFSLEDKQASSKVLGNFESALGGGESVPRPSFMRTKATDGQCIVLCSDGVWEHLSSEDVAKLATSPGRCRADVSADAIWKAAHARWDEADDEATEMSVFVCWL